MMGAPYCTFLGHLEKNLIYVGQALTLNHCEHLIMSATEFLC